MRNITVHLVLQQCFDLVQFHLNNICPQNTTDSKNAGNAKFEDGKYTAASSIYTKALHMR